MQQRNRCLFGGGLALGATALHFQTGGADFEIQRLRQGRQIGLRSDRRGLLSASACIAHKECLNYVRAGYIARRKSVERLDLMDAPF